MPQRTGGSFLLHLAKALRTKEAEPRGNDPEHHLGMKETAVAVLVVHVVAPRTLKQAGVVVVVAVVPAAVRLVVFRRYRNKHATSFPITVRIISSTYLPWSITTRLCAQANRETRVGIS